MFIGRFLIAVGFVMESVTCTQEVQMFGMGVKTAWCV